MLNEVEHHYRTLLDQFAEVLGETCLTWCQAHTAVELARVLGADPDSAAPRTLSVAYDESYEHIMRTGHGNTIVVGKIPPWFIAMEPGDTRGAHSLSRLSSGGEALSFVIGDTLRHYSFIYADHGQIECRLRWMDEPAGDIDAIRHHLAGLSLSRELSSDEWKVHALILAERMTGIRLTIDWLSREHIRFL